MTPINADTVLSSESGPAGPTLTKDRAERFPKKDGSSEARTAEAQYEQQCTS